MTDEKPKALLVEDEKAYTMLMSGMLKAKGFDVVAVEKRADAEALLSKNSYALVITDRGLVGESTGGIDLVKNIKEQYSKTPVIMVTGMPGDAKSELEESGHGDVVVLEKAGIIETFPGAIAPYSPSHFGAAEGESLPPIEQPHTSPHHVAPPEGRAQPDDSPSQLAPLAFQKLPVQPTSKLAPLPHQQRNDGSPTPGRK